MSGVDAILDERRVFGFRIGAANDVTDALNIWQFTFDVLSTSGAAHRRISRGHRRRRRTEQIAGITQDISAGIDGWIDDTLVRKGCRARHVLDCFLWILPRR